MDEQEHKDFLTGIAKEVGKLIVKPANLNRFRQQDRIFWELCKVSFQAMEQDRQAAESNPHLRDKEVGPPKKDWIWYDQERSKTIPKGYWRRPDKDLPPNPVDWLSLPSFIDEIVPGMFSTQCQAPETEEIVLPYYALLTIIHDNEKIDNIQINNGIWSEDEGWISLILEDALNWHYLMEWHVGNRLRSYIELALEHVKTDLATKLTEIQQKIKPIQEPLKRKQNMAHRKKKKQSKTLSSLVPELAPFDTQPDIARLHTIVSQAWVAARYAAENDFTSDEKEKLKSLFWDEYSLTTLSMRDFLNDLPNLAQDDRNHWHRKWEALLERTKGRLFESLDNNVSNNSRFQELGLEQLQITQGLGFELGSWQQGKIDPSTRLLVPKKPARTRQEFKAKGKQKKKTKKRNIKVSSDLTPKETEVFTLIHVQRKTQQQAAIEMRCSPQNISKLLKKAETKMKAQHSRSINLNKAQKLPEDRRGQTNISNEDI
jgi:predicted DNA-binding protein (UPF0251 family)